MANNWFQFKQFRIEQENTAMKVGTDGVLLGAWADPIQALSTQPDRILDVGTGTGLLALMMAQKTGAEIYAVELDSDAASQAGINFSNSSWSDRLHILHADFRNNPVLRRYAFDYIISNPPFFKDAVPAPEKRRSLARHDHSLSLPDLIVGVSELLQPLGWCGLILPANRFKEANRLFVQQGFFLRRKTTVFSRRGTSPIRVMGEWCRENGRQMEDEIVLYADGRNSMSEEYRHLTDDFYPSLKKEG